MINVDIVNSEQWLLVLHLGDLLKMLVKLVKQKGDKFDYTVIRTIGKSHHNKVYKCILIIFYPKDM
jgi:hypothetical protein